MEHCTEDTALVTLPSAQFGQVEPPLAGCDFPTSQPMHEPVPMADWNVPVKEEEEEHSESASDNSEHHQSVATVGEVNEPAAHGVHVIAPIVAVPGSGAYRPAAQLPHDSRPCVEAKVPIEHATHAEAEPLERYVPNGHAVHASCFVVAAYFPFSQSVHLVALEPGP